MNDPQNEPPDETGPGCGDEASPARPPGVCVPWEEKLAELPPIPGDEALVRRTWEEVDSLAHMYVWQCLVSF